MRGAEPHKRGYRGKGCFPLWMESILRKEKEY
jgi:hypothetical protein